MGTQRSPGPHRLVKTIPLKVTALSLLVSSCALAPVDTPRRDASKTQAAKASAATIEPPPPTPATGLTRGGTLPLLYAYDARAKATDAAQCVVCEQSADTKPITIVAIGDPAQPRFAEDIRDLDAVLELVDRGRVDAMVICVRADTGVGSDSTVYRAVPQPELAQLRGRSRVELPFYSPVHHASGADFLADYQPGAASIVLAAEADRDIVFAEVGIADAADLVELIREQLDGATSRAVATRAKTR